MQNGKKSDFSRNTFTNRAADKQNRGFGGFYAMECKNVMVPFPAHRPEHRQFIRMVCFAEITSRMDADRSLCVEKCLSSQAEGAGEQ